MSLEYEGDWYDAENGGLCGSIRGNKITQAGYRLDHSYQATFLSSHVRYEDDDGFTYNGYIIGEGLLEWTHCYQDGSITGKEYWVRTNEKGKCSSSEPDVILSK